MHLKKDNIVLSHVAVSYFESLISNIYKKSAPEVLTVPQIDFILLLYYNPGISLKNIAIAMGNNQSNVTCILKSLLSKGIIKENIKKNKDRRFKNYVLSDYSLLNIPKLIKNVKKNFTVVAKHFPIIKEAMERIDSFYRETISDGYKNE
jgi:DNA-binding MarR family transcriptional regulator